MNVSIATIPPRIRNNNIFNCIDGFLNQTIEVNKIFINLPNKFNRFDNLTEEELLKLKNYNKKVVLTFTNYDSPILKYLGCIPHLKDDDIIFVGDDDQVYKEDLLEKMKDGFYNDDAVFQNRFHQVKKGTAGIIHGFVGLMMKRKVLNNLNNFVLPPQLWIDDQLLSIYFHKNNISILPSPIHDFDDIYNNKYLNQQGMEQIGDGALCKMDLSRKKQIRELEIKYDVFFLKKDNIKGKGKIKLYPKCNFHFWNNKEFKINHPNIKLTNSYLINYHSDNFGLKKIKEQENAIYINRNFLIKDDFDLYEFLLNNDDIYFDENNILLIKNTYKNKI